MSQESLLNFDDALARILAAFDSAALRSREVVPLSAAASRVLADPVLADRDLPEAANSAMDGFAVRAADLAETGPGPWELPLGEPCYAGQPAGDLPAGLARPITTGGLLPTGADAVVRVEDTQPAGPDRVRLLRQPRAGDFVRSRGGDFRAGDELLPRGTTLGPAALAIAAAVGADPLPVVTRPRIAICSSGDEVVPVWQRPRPDQVRDANGTLLSAAVAAAGGQPISFGIVPDQPDQARQTLTRAIEAADLVITSGGISMGQRDPFVEALPAVGVQRILHGVAIKPGKPVFFGISSRRRPVFALPGNQASVTVTFSLFVRPLLDAWLGRCQPSRRWCELPITCRLENRWQRDHFLRGDLHFDGGRVRVTPLPKQDSHLLTSLLAPVLIRHRGDQPIIEAGSPVACLIGDWP